MQELELRLLHLYIISLEFLDNDITYCERDTTVTTVTFNQDIRKIMLKPVFFVVDT